MVIIACPYCFQKIDTVDKEKSFDLPIKLLCPKCRKYFILNKSGVETIPSELRMDSINYSIKNLASHY